MGRSLAGAPIRFERHVECARGHGQAWRSLAIETAVGPIEAGLMGQQQAQGDFIFGGEFIVGQPPRFEPVIDIPVEIQNAFPGQIQNQRRDHQLGRRRRLKQRIGRRGAAASGLELAVGLGPGNVEIVDDGDAQRRNL